MKKMIIVAVAIAGTLGISSYSISKPSPTVTPSQKQDVIISSPIINADTIGSMRVSRANLAQAD